jgi:hypothetical protein
VSVSYLKTVSPETLGRSPPGERQPLLTRPLKSVGPLDSAFCIDRYKREAPTEVRASAGAYRIRGCDALSSDGTDADHTLTAAA